MVVSDYFKSIDAIIVEEMPVEELETLDDLRARKYSPTCLSFTKEAAKLRTHFRDYVLQTIFELAKAEVGDALKTADVIVERDYYEPEPPRLMLCLWADIDVAERRRADIAIIEAIIKESADWFEVEREEYRNIIGHDLMLLRI